MHLLLDVNEEKLAFPLECLKQAFDPIIPKAINTSKRRLCLTLFLKIFKKFHLFDEI